jgi:hypothetical protein
VDFDMSQATLRYFGVTLGEVPHSERTDARLGRFIATPDPMPVGTAMMVDETPHVVTRVEEGATSGMWLWADGMVLPLAVPAHAPVTAPTAIDDIPTAPMSPPPVAAAPPVVPEQDAPTVITDDEPGKPDESKRKRRRPAKTVIGR